VKSKDEKRHLDARNESQENARPESNCRAESKLVTLSEDEVRDLMLVLRYVAVSPHRSRRPLR